MVRPGPKSGNAYLSGNALANLTDAMCPSRKWWYLNTSSTRSSGIHNFSPWYSLLFLIVYPAGHSWSGWWISCQLSPHCGDSAYKSSQFLSMTVVGLQLAVVSWTGWRWSTMGRRRSSGGNWDWNLKLGYPLGAIVTLPGTGSEASDSGVGLTMRHPEVPWAS